MQRYADNVQLSNGNAATGTTVTVQTIAGVNATIYSANDVAATYASNVLTVDNTGEYYFYAANGRYTLTIKAPGYAQEIRADILLYDPDDIGAGRHAIWITAGSMSPSTTGGCAALATIDAPTVGRPDIQTLDFDKDTPESAQFNIRMPKSWDEGVITFCPVFTYNAEDDTEYTCSWSLEAVSINDQEQFNVAFGTPVTSDKTVTSGNWQWVGVESADMTVANAGVEGLVRFKVTRVADDATNDTLPYDARLHGLTIYITTDSVNDA
jgi:hypothetical protein